ncbi:NYN domain-containing protein [Oerskovia sp. M15]
MAFEREYISTFVMCTGDSDFSPLVHKLRELNKRVIGIGVENSTSKLLPPACDEFLFYDRLEGVEIPDEPVERKRSSGSSNRSTTRKSGRSSSGTAKGTTATPVVEPVAPATPAAETAPEPTPPRWTSRPSWSPPSSTGLPRSTRTRTSRSSSPRPSPTCPARRAGPSSPRRSSAPCCARTPRSARPTTASATSVSSCATSRSVASSS